MRLCSRIPLLNDLLGFLSGLLILHHFNDLDVGSFKLFSVCNINLADLDMCLCVFDKQNGFAILVGGAGSGRGHIALLIDAEGRIRCHGIAFRCNSLTEDIFHSRLQTFDRMRLCSRIPLLNDLLGFLSGLLILHHFNDLDVGSFKLFSVCNINLADLDMCLCVFDKQNGFAILVGGAGSGRGHIALLIDAEGRIRCHGISIRSDDFAQNVFHPCL